MNEPETRYQKYLARKRQKQQTRKAMPAHLRGPMLSEMRWVVHAPVHECLVPASLFEQGLGNLVLSRALPDGRMALSVFLLDMFCLGVKNALFTIGTRLEYDAFLRRGATSERLEPIAPACFRKLVEGGVAYARELGFSPHADYAEAREIFADVDAAACPTHFEYGRDGKPLYVSRPDETATHVRAILEHLERHVGPGNFYYLVRASQIGEI
jgi:hypothetical protein